MRRALRNLGRMWSIGGTFARYDALFVLDDVPAAWPVRLAARTIWRAREPHLDGKRDGERLALALRALGPAFIKLGQALSVRVDLVGEEMADDLSDLQDRLPPVDGRTARAAIEAEFGRPVEDIFPIFEDRAFAAASIAQVHRAGTPDGRDVAVKVLRPDIERAFERDLDLLAWLAGLAERTQPALRRLKPVEVVDTIARTVATELDLRFEAAAGEELGENFADDPSFRVPEIDWQRTTARVLTTEWVDGIPIGHRDALIDAGHLPEDLVAGMARVFFLQVFRDGFFHADLHPGNLFVDDDGAICAVDFGIMGRLDKRTRTYLADMLVGFLTGDYQRVAEVHIQAGYVPASESTEEFAQAARSIAEPIFGLPLDEISLARLLAQLFAITERFHMETQPQLLLLQKTMLVAEGVGRSLYPGTNMWELARPLIEDWMIDNMGPDARIRDAVSDITRSLERLPGLVADLEDTVEDMNRQGLRLHPDSVRRLAEERDARQPRWGWWAGAGAVAIALIAVIS